MRSVALFVLLFAPSALFAATKPNPAEYKLTVHVQCSFGWKVNELLVATVGGKQLELTSVEPAALPLALGDYPARLEEKQSGKSYEVNQSYELLFPDGKVREYRVTGFGTGLCGSEGH
jgi:hypothetical protein